MKFNSKNKNNNVIHKIMQDNSRNKKSNERQAQVEDLTAFEEEMIDLVHEIRFYKVKSSFQNK